MERSSTLKISVSVLLFGWLCTLGSGNQVQQWTDHCVNNLFPKMENLTHMQFTKEVISTEYAILADFKSLHCCAKGYRSIEWMKDGKAYPWSSDNSSFILYPEASNQTIYTRHVQASDVGNYTCVVRNDTVKTTKHISLNAQAQSNRPDVPLTTYHPHDLFVELDSEARFYCEAFVGKVGLPDAKSDISWFQIVNDHPAEVDGIITKVLSENGQTIGAYLRIPHVQAHNYGVYMCRVQFSSPAHRLDMYAALSGKPSEADISQRFLGLYHTLAAIISAAVAALLVLSAWYLIRSLRTRRSEKSQCQAADKDFSGPRRV